MIQSVKIYTLKYVIKNRELFRLSDVSLLLLLFRPFPLLIAMRFSIVEPSVLSWLGSRVLFRRASKIQSIPLLSWLCPRGAQLHPALAFDTLLNTC